MITNSKDKNPYEDIINLSHPVSVHHERMSVLDRAAQFAPFAALTGFDGAIKETARLTDERIELDVDARALLDEKLRILQQHVGSGSRSRSHSLSSSCNQQEVEFTFFQADEMKAGGEYVTVRGAVKKIDEYEHAVVMNNGTWIPIEDIVEISAEMFQAVEDFFE